MEIGSWGAGWRGVGWARKAKKPEYRREKRSERWWLEVGPEGAPRGGGYVKEQVKSSWTPVNWCEHRTVLGEASWFVIFTHQSIYFG